MLDPALCCANSAKWHLQRSWLKACKKGVLSAPIYPYLVIYTGIFPGCLKCKQPIPQQSAGDPILMGWKCKSGLRNTYRVLEMLIMGHVSAIQLQWLRYSHMICSSSLNLLTPRAARRAKTLLRCATV